MSEARLAARAVAWFARHGLAVHQEVAFRGRRIDIVACGTRRVAAVEAKRALGLDVIEQAARWIPYATEVWVAAPRLARPSRQAVAEAACRYLGIGVLDVGRAPVVLVEPVTRAPKLGHELVEALHPDQITRGVAGSNGGGYSTAFGRTAERLAAYVAGHDGCTLREAVEAIEHHYRGPGRAVAALAALLAKSRGRPVALRAVRADGRGGKATLWYRGDDVF